MNRRSKIILIVGAAAFIISIVIMQVGRSYFSGESKSGWVDVVPNNYPNSHIDNLVQDNSGVVWFGESRVIKETHEGGGVSSYISQPTIKSVNGETIDIPINFLEIETKTFLFDNEGNLWVDREDRHGNNQYDLLVRDDQGSWKRYTPSDEFRNFKLEAVDGNGRAWGWVWLQDYTRLFSFIELDEENMVFSYNRPNALENVLWDVGWVIDNQGNIWVVHEYTLKTFGADGSWIDKKELKRLNISCLAFDRQGKLWISYAAGSLVVIDEEMKDQIYPGPREEIEHCTVDDQGRFWGVYFTDLYMYTPGGEWTVYDPKNSGLQGGASIADILIDEQGGTLVATYFGLARFDPEQLSSVSLSESNKYIRFSILPAIPLAILLVFVNVFAFTQPAAFRKRNLLEFGLGFFGFFIFFHLYYSYAYDNTGTGDLILYCGFLAIPIVILSFIILLVTRRWWAVLGLFSAITINAILTLLFVPELALYPSFLFDFTPFHIEYKRW